MLKTFRVKFFQKLMILCVLSAGVIVFSSVNKTQATVCCDTCEPPYAACQYECYVTEKPWGVAACIAANCDPPYAACMSNCSFC